MYDEEMNQRNYWKHLQMNKKKDVHQTEQWEGCLDLYRSHKPIKSLGDIWRCIYIQASKAQKSKVSKGDFRISSQRTLHGNPQSHSHKIQKWWGLQQVTFMGHQQEYAASIAHAFTYSLHTNYTHLPTLHVTESKGKDSASPVKMSQCVSLLLNLSSFHGFMSMNFCASSVPTKVFAVRNRRSQCI